MEAVNPRDPYDRVRLAKAIESSYRSLSPFRESRTELICDYAGQLYGRTFWDARNQRERQKLVNTMHQTAETHSVELAANLPRYLITAKSVERAGFARHFQESLNNTCAEIALEETLQAVTLDAFFGPAFVKVHLAESELVQIEADVWMDPGRPFASRVSLDDIVFDFDARDFRLARYVADKYRVPTWMLREMYGHDRKASRAVEMAIMETIRRDSRHDETRDLSNTSGEWGSSEEDRTYEDMVTLCDVYLPSFELVVTFACEPDDFSIFADIPPIAVQDWTDAMGEMGPYHYLNLAPVPDNVLPSSPAIHIKALFELTNSLYSKSANQCRRQKSVGIIPATGSGVDDAQNIMRAKDGDVVAVKDLPPNGFQEARFGGLDNNTLAGAMHFDQLADRQSGNLSLRAGLGAQAPTARQEAQLGTQVSRAEGYKASRVAKFAVGVGRHIGELMFNDPVGVQHGTISIPGTPYAFDSPWRPEDREGTLDDYIIEIDLESMRYRTSAERNQAIDSVLAMLGPLLPMLAQQGIQIDWWRLIEIKADLLSEPRILEIFRVAGALPQDTPGSGHDRTLPANTSREYIRRNEPSQATQPGQMQQIMQMLSAGRGGQGGAAA